MFITRRQGERRYYNNERIKGNFVRASSAVVSSVSVQACRMMERSAGRRNGGESWRAISRVFALRVTQRNATLKARLKGKGAHRKGFNGDNERGLGWVRSSIKRLETKHELELGNDKTKLRICGEAIAVWHFHFYNRVWGFTSSTPVQRHSLAEELTFIYIVYILQSNKIRPPRGQY